MAMLQVDKTARKSAMERHNNKQRQRPKLGRPRPSEFSIIRGKHIFHEISYELRLRVLLQTLIATLKFLPTLLWAFFTEACIISDYRYEWPEKYRAWSVWITLNYRSLHQTLNLIALPVAVTSSAGFKYVAKKKLKETELVPHDQNVRHNHNLCTRVKLNVGGRVFETQLRTLQRYPHTLLGNSDRRLPYYDPIKEMYYFDRSRAYFEPVLYYYQSGGRVVCPANLVTEALVSEFEFFALGPDAIRALKLEEGAVDDDDEDAEIMHSLPKSLLKKKLWLLLEHPTSSPQAKLVSIFSVYVVLISVISFCLETEPMLRLRDTVWYKLNENTQDDDYDQQTNDLRDPLQMIEAICVTWFFIELLLRFFAAPGKYAFCTNFMNIIDMLAIVPFAVGFINNNIDLFGSDSGDGQDDASEAFELVRVFRVVRIFRIFKLSRHVKGLKILGWTLSSSLNELGLLMFFLVICVILFSTGVYIAEEDSPNTKFISIPHSAYWAITTMTTVGYGDIVPRTVWGKIIGSLCAVAGVLTLALPMPVMVSNFNYFYTMELNKARSATEGHDHLHVKQCPFRPSNKGVHPMAKKLEKENSWRAKRRHHKRASRRTEGSKPSKAGSVASILNKIRSMSATLKERLLGAQKKRFRSIVPSQRPTMGAIGPKRLHSVAPTFVHRPVESTH